MTKMRAARMYGYRQPLVLEEIPIPDIGPSEVLVKVGGAGMCRTDFQLIDGYFHSNLPVTSPTAGSRRLLLTPLGREGPVQPVGCCVRHAHLPVHDASIAGIRRPLG